MNRRPMESRRGQMGQVRVRVPAKSTSGLRAIKIEKYNDSEGGDELCEALRKSLYSLIEVHAWRKDMTLDRPMTEMYIVAEPGEEWRVFRG